MSATEPSSNVGHNSTTAGPSSSSPEKVTVLIIGAGSTGLALAQGLKQANISCIVVERDERLDARSRDWNMGMHWGEAALKSLVCDETWSRLQSVQVDPSQPTAKIDDLRFVNGESGELISALQVQKFYRLRRSKLRALLAEDLDIRYNASFKNMAFSSSDSLAIVYFNDGSSIGAKLVVGADGARSSVRQLLLGPDQASVRRLPYCATFIHSKFTREQALFIREFHPLYIAAIHPGGFFSFLGMQDAADPDRPETWTFFFYISWYSSLEEQDRTANWTDAQRLDQVKEFSRTFTDPFKSAFEWASADCKVWYSCLHDFDPGAAGNRWGNLGGRVTLAGDSAHTMTYQRGQGLNHSVTDAAKLCEAILKFTSKESTQAAAISSYEDDMIHRAGGEVRLSTTNTEMLHDWQKVLQSPLMKAGLKEISKGAAAN
ncbi:hypothetical protein ACJ73_00534 [Blastomyces percursus]|uniref:FAD-binding domain-containing protein n=1 Tax=Blastomyces percursus TaxID=1658174 RepID=A0A1J9QGW1_9EURO|nr:hypothetical protein ACJ73_00534 [Blastomyces percursus]